MKHTMKAVIRQLLNWLKRWFWTKPTSEPPPLKATDVANQYTCIKYKDQWINLRIAEIDIWNKMSRKDRRGMAQRFKVLEKKGKLRFEKINGKMTCIRNKDYEQKAKDNR